MFTSTLTAMSALKMVLFSKHDIPLFCFVKILRVQFLFKHRIDSIWVCSKLHHRTFVYYEIGPISFQPALTTPKTSHGRHGFMDETG
jgi:hypothetical protein